MKTIKYVGDNDEVQVRRDGRIIANVTRDSTIDVSDELAVGLLDQPTNWIVANSPKTTKKEVA